MNFGEWFTTKAVPFLKKIGPVLFGIGVLVIGLLVAKEIFERVRGIFGAVKKPDAFIRIPGDEAHVLVRSGAAWKKVDLPAGAVASKVTAVELTPGGDAVVEVKNAGIDGA